MSRDTGNLEQLRRLLKLKQYEQPPPLYFDEFSSRVITLIRLGREGEPSVPFTEAEPWRGSWLHRAWAALVARPAVAGAFSLAICASIVTGVIRSGEPGIRPAAFVPDSVPSGFSQEKNKSSTDTSLPFQAKRAVFVPTSLDPVTDLTVTEL